MYERKSQAKALQVASLRCGAELCFAEPSASSFCGVTSTWATLMVLSVLVSPGCSRKDGYSRGTWLKGLPGKDFIVILQLLSVLKYKNAIPGCKIVLTL